MVTTTTRYALRALVQMARLPSGATILGRDLAEQTQIPANYLSKILLQLRNAGLVETARGQGGGYGLSQPPKKIPLMTVVRLFEGAVVEQGCLLGEQEVCSDESPCSAHEAWKKVSCAYVRFLTTKTIADICKPTDSESAAVVRHEGKRG